MHISLKKEIKESRTGKAGLIILALVILAAALAPLLSSYDPGQQSTTSLLSPSYSHWLGTNHVGQDIWSQLLYGARTSLFVGFGVGILDHLEVIEHFGRADVFALEIGVIVSRRRQRQPVGVDVE